MKNNNVKEAGDIRSEPNGTTTVGIKTKNGVIVATDRKVSSFISTAKKDMNKIMTIHSKAVMTMAGVVGHAQKLSQKIKNKADLYEYRRNREMPIKSITYSLRNIFENDHYHVGPIVAGIDKTGGYIYSVEPSGSIINYDNYTSTGSGTNFAIGVLEQKYSENLTIDEGKSIALDAIKTAAERDNMTGDGFVIATITDNGTDLELFDSIPNSI